MDAAALVRLDRGAHGPGTATITLDSPANRNALSAQVRRELVAALDDVLADDGVRVVVLTHTGPVFCSGMDLREAVTDPTTTRPPRASREAAAPRRITGVPADRQGVTEFPAILDRLWNAPKPVVARVAGAARAAGVGMVAACDIAVAAEQATFAFSEVRVGVVPALISLTVLPRVAPRAAHELFLTGEPFSATRAAEIGLVNAAVPEAALDAATRRFVDALLLGAPGALAGTKELLRRPRAAALADDLDAMARLSARYFAGAEGQEGMRAFAEKRRPSWVLPE